MESKGEDQQAEGQTRKPLTFSERVDRVFASTMPPALAYAIGVARSGYPKGEIAALLRMEGLQHPDYGWLTPRGDAIADIFEQAIRDAMPKAVTEPAPSDAPPAEPPLEQPAAPTYTPDPNPAGVPDVPVVNPDPAARATASDVMGLAAITST